MSIKRAQKLISIAIVIGAFSVACMFQTTKASAQTEKQEEISIESVLEYTNQERLNGSLGQLKINAKLQDVAQKKAEDMARNGYFSHVGSDGKKVQDWAKESGYEYDVFGENLAQGFVDTKSLTQAWKDSPSHRENMMKSDYEEVGIGIAAGEYGGKEVVFVAVHFASPQKGLIEALFE